MIHFDRDQIAVSAGGAVAEGSPGRGPTGHRPPFTPRKPPPAVNNQ